MYSKLGITSLVFSIATADFAELSTPGRFLVKEDASSLQCVNVTVLMDVAVEDAEVFHINISTSDPSVLVTRASSTVTIVDNTGIYGCSFLLHGQPSRVS